MTRTKVPKSNNENIGASVFSGSNTFLPVWPRLTRDIMPSVIMPIPPKAKA